MQNEETAENNELETQDVDQSEYVEDEEPTEEDTESTEEESEDDSEVEARLKQLENENAKLQRLLNKKSQTPESKKIIKKTKTESVDVDERILVNQGIDDEVLAELKDIAKAKRMSLIDARNTPVFKAFEKQFEEEKKTESARLGASKGSGTRREQKTFKTPGLSKEEHRKMWEANYK